LEILVLGWRQSEDLPAALVSKDGAAAKGAAGRTTSVGLLKI